MTTSIPSLIAQCRKQLKEISPWPWENKDKSYYFKIFDKGSFPDNYKKRIWKKLAVCFLTKGNVKKTSEQDANFITSCPQTIETLVNVLESAIEVIEVAARIDPPSSLPYKARAWLQTYCVAKKNDA